TSASLVALMSDWETHPVAALEAIGLERPLLVADNSGLRELAGRGLAAAIPTDASPRELAGAAIDAIARGGPRRPSDFPTWDGCATGLEDLYLSVVGRA
ncbi:MAG: glycosyltransferase family 1 protein, partial [Acidobacteriota bacterium]|nr:glycosyltransferase family 1 protein [Acidobacteriota bacterium]